MPRDHTRSLRLTISIPSKDKHENKGASASGTCPAEGYEGARIKDEIVTTFPGQNQNANEADGDFRAGTGYSFSLNALMANGFESTTQPHGGNVEGFYRPVVGSETTESHTLSRQLMKPWPSMPSTIPPARC